MNNTTCFIKNDEYEVNEVNDTLVILEPNFEEVHILRAIEKSIWNLCDSNNSFVDIVTALETQYNAQGIENDVREFLVSLLEKGIIRIHQSDNGQEASNG